MGNLPESVFFRKRYSGCGPSKKVTVNRKHLWTVFQIDFNDFKMRHDSLSGKNGEILRCRHTQTGPILLPRPLTWEVTSSMKGTALAKQ